MFVVERLIIEKHVFQSKHRVFVNGILRIRSPHATITRFSGPEFVVLYGTGIEAQVRAELQSVDRQFDIQRIATQVTGCFHRTVHCTRNKVHHRIVDIIRPW